MHRFFLIFEEVESTIGLICKHLGGYLGPGKIRDRSGIIMDS